MNYFDKNNPMQSLLPALRDIITSPKAFFSALPGAAFHSNSLFFGSIIIFAATFIGVPFYSLGMLFMIPVIWGLSLISLWIWSAYMSWAVKNLAKGKLTTANAFQISAYAATPMALATVPYIGAIAGLWNLYMLWVALVNHCKISPGMALTIIAVPTLMLAAALFALSGMMVQLFPQLA